MEKLFEHSFHRSLVGIPKGNEEKLLLIRQNLDRVQSLSDVMLGRLNSFQDRLSQVESRIAKVHQTTQAMMRQRDNVDVVLHSFERITAEFEVMSEVESVLSRGPQGGVRDFVNALDRLYDAITFFQNSKQFTVAEKTLHSLRGSSIRAMRKAETYVEGVLKRHQVPVDLTERESTVLVEFLAADVCNEIRMLYERLLRHGNTTFLPAYVEVRSAYLVECLHLLYEQLMGEDSERVDGAVTSHCARGDHPFIFYSESLLLLLKSEKALIDTLSRPISGSETTTDTSLDSALRSQFDQIAAPVILSFLHNGDALLRGVRGMESSGVFTILNMQIAVEMLLTEMDSVVRSRELAQKLLDFMKNVQSVARKTFVDIEESVRNHPSRQMVKDGTVHELTSNTLTLFKRLLEYQDIIENLLPPSSDAQLSAVGRYVISVLADLEANLETKAKKSGTLGTIFLLNNYAFILKAIEGSELALLISRESRKKYQGLIDRQVDAYLDGWAGAAACLLSKQQMKQMKAKDEKQATKTKFSRFNAIFEELYRTQKSYSIPDRELVRLLQDKIEQMILPLYSDLYRQNTRSGGGVDFCRHMSKYVVYSIDTLQSLIQSLFTTDRPDV